MSKLKVIFHVNEPQRWEVALGNITNLFRDVGEENADVVVLANGPSVLAYTDESKVSQMKELSLKGAQFLSCKNSLKKMKNIMFR